MQNVPYSFFTFISDRDKGLKQALGEVFPTNHALSCAIHIQRNVCTKFGHKPSECVSKISKTFSSRLEDEFFGKIRKHSESALKYLQEIEASEWRSTEWVRDNTLPPRYGITSTNISESSNAMFDKARDMVWVDCIDSILLKMSVRISKLRNASKESKGIVPSMAAIVKSRFDNCAGFDVIQLEESIEEYMIVRSMYRPGSTQHAQNQHRNKDLHLWSLARYASPLC
jgi:transposase-like protein